jgi:hypothetical protein
MIDPQIDEEFAIANLNPVFSAHKRERVSHLSQEERRSFDQPLPVERLETGLAARQSF